MAVTLSISITQNSQSVANNTSNVTVKATAKWTGGSYNALGTCYGHIKIDGTEYSFSGISFNSNASASGSEVVMTKTVTVTHGSNGAKTLSCSASFRTGTSSGTVTASASKTLTTIARKSTLSVGNGTLNTAQTLTVTRQSSSNTHTITAKCGSASSTICTKSSSTSISFTPPLAWASQNTSGTSLNVTYTITTYNGSTSLGSNSYTKTCSIPSSVKPTCSITVTDGKDYLSTYGKYIKGLSTFQVTVTPTLAYESAIASYSTTANGSTYTASTFTTAVLKTSGTLSISATVKDKRGRSGSASTSVSVYNYSAPSISALNVERCNSDGTSNGAGAYLKVTFSATVTSLDSKNKATYAVKYKKSSASSYTSATMSTYTNVYSVSNGSYIFAADTSSSYDIILTVSDNFYSGDSAKTKSATGPSVSKLWSILAGGKGIALGKIAELAGWLDIGYKTRFRDNVLFDNAKEIYGRGTDGVNYQLLGLNANDTTAVGYGSYNANIGTTSIYGHNVRINSKNDVTVTAPMRLTTTTDASGTADKRPALIIGDPTGEHLEFDGNEIMSKANATTIGPMYINKDGGIVSISGPVRLMRTTDASGTTDNSPALSIGTPSGVHLEFDNNEIMAKSSATSTGSLYINTDGGNVTINGCVMAKNSVLWSGAYYMSASQTCTLSAAISKQANGAIFVWSYYDNGEADNSAFNMFFVPKYFVSAHSGKGISMPMYTATANTFTNKYLYVKDTSIVGYQNNNIDAYTLNIGIATSPKKFVLRYIIGV